jgi:hypothetical protein
VTLRGLSSLHCTLTFKLQGHEHSINLIISLYIDSQTSLAVPSCVAPRDSSIRYKQALQPHSKGAARNTEITKCKSSQRQSGSWNYQVLTRKQRRSIFNCLSLSRILERFRLTTAKEETPPQSAFDTFTPFPNLPPELRLEIWKHAVPYPRVMQIHCI